MPHADETFYKMKCGWAADPKVVALGRFGPVDACLARDLFSQMIDYSRRELTDGMVPREAVTALAAPLPPEHALALADNLADEGPFGSLCQWYASGNATGIANGNAPGNALRILAYARWNDTRAEVQARKDKGTKAARTRWEASGATGNAPSIASSNAASTSGGDASSNASRGRAQVDTEQEQEQDKPSTAEDRSTVPARAAEDDEVRTALENAVMAFMTGAGHPVNRPQAAALIEMTLAGRKPRDPGAYVLATLKKDPAAQLRRVATSRQPPPARDVLPDARRPGGPAADVATRAAEARAMLDAKLNPVPAAVAAAEEGGPDDLPDW